VCGLTYYLYVVFECGDGIGLSLPLVKEGMKKV